MRWLPTIVLTGVGAIAGAVLTLAAGSVCVDGVSESFCGMNFLVWNMSSASAIALGAASGGSIGALLGLVVTIVLTRRRAAG